MCNNFINTIQNIKLIEVGDYIKLLEPLPEEEQRELFKEYKGTKDLKIREKLILHNLKLVSWTISKYYYDKNILEYDDYFQMGTIGLINSIESYDYNKGAFSSYSIYSIKQSITRGIEDYGRTIRVPSHMIQKISRVRSIKKELYTELEREPTPREISLKMKVSLGEIKEILKVVDDPVSLNIPISEEGDSTLEAMIKDDSPEPHEVAESKIFIEQFQEEARKTLSELQYKFVTMYLGIGTREHTLQELAKKYNCSNREYVRMERDKGFRALRHTRYFIELRKEFEEETSYYKSIDYSQPRSGGGLPTSSVENIALERERRLERLEKRYNEREKERKLYKM